jgi:hypothetical protein
MVHLGTEGAKPSSALLAALAWSSGDVGHPLGAHPAGVVSGWRQTTHIRGCTITHIKNPRLCPYPPLLPLWHVRYGY